MTAHPGRAQTQWNTYSAGKCLAVLTYNGFIGQILAKSALKFLKELLILLFFNFLNSSSLKLQAILNMFVAPKFHF